MAAAAQFQSLFKKPKGKLCLYSFSKVAVPAAHLITTGVVLLSPSIAPLRSEDPFGFFKVKPVPGAPEVLKRPRVLYGKPYVPMDDGPTDGIKKLVLAKFTEDDVQSYLIHVGFGRYARNFLGKNGECELDLSLFVMS